MADRLERQSHEVEGFCTLMERWRMTYPKRMAVPGDAYRGGDTGAGVGPPVDLSVVGMPLAISPFSDRSGPPRSDRPVER